MPADYYTVQPWGYDSVVDIDGTSIEFIETDLTEEEIWGDWHKSSVIYLEEE